MAKRINRQLLDNLIRSKYETHLAFAAAAGVTRQYVSVIIKGERTPSLLTVIKFASLLDVTVDDLLEEVRE